MPEESIILKFDKYISVKDDIGFLECELCDKICCKEDELWYDGDFECRGMSICKECFEKNKKPNKSDIFVRHIENHFKEMNIDGKVICKICGKTIDEIYKEEK